MLLEVSSKIPVRTMTTRHGSPASHQLIQSTTSQSDENREDLAEIWTRRLGVGVSDSLVYVSVRLTLPVLCSGLFGGDGGVDAAN